ncbi:hypothetical protein [Kitasatospora sp. NPDC097691]|uniref:hypothetical protein n=1 Tax=Kitasatospora sp. NPDC097691 TaxID=3157231 RepID=UPI003317EDE2
MKGIVSALAVAFVAVGAWGAIAPKAEVNSAALIGPSGVDFSAALTGPSGVHFTAPIAVAYDTAWGS